MTDALINDWKTTLTASLSSSGTSISVAATAPTELRSKTVVLRVSDTDGVGHAEFIRATIPSNGASPWTVARGVESSDRFPAVAHASGSIVVPVLTVGIINALISTVGGPLTVLSKTANYTMLPTDGNVKADSTSGPITITLPSATAAVVGWPYRVKRISGGSNNVTVATQSSQTIDGASTLVLTLPWQEATVYSDGSNWLIASTVVAKHPPIAAFTPTVNFRNFSVVNSSTDPDGDSLTYNWDFGDGTAHSTLTAPNHTYGTDNTFTVTLVVTDSTGLTNSTSHSVVTTTPPSQRVPFATTGPSKSIFNKTLAERFPSGIPVLAKAANDAIINSIVTPTDNAPRPPFSYFSSDTTQFTVPVYIVDDTTPLRTIAYSGIHCEASDSTTTNASGGGTASGIPIPDGVLPSAPPGSGGGDSEVHLWNPIAGEGWDVWRAVPDGSGVWSPNGSGQYECTNFSHYVGEPGSPGSFATTPATYASRGPGFPYIAGLIRPWEIDDGGTNLGTIHHCGAFAYDGPSPLFVYPAVKSDGSGDNTLDIAEGGYLKLRDDFQISDLADPLARQWATMARDYGLVCADHAGNPKAYFEAQESLAGGPYATASGIPWAGRVPSNVLRGIPIEWFVVVDPAGTSSTREADLIPADALTGVGSVALLETQVGLNQDGVSGSVITTTLSAIATGQKLALEIVLRGNNGVYVTGVTGCGVQWKRSHRYQEPSPTTPSIGFAQNLEAELWEATADGSATAGTITVSFNAGVSAAIARVKRWTAGAVLRKFWRKDFAAVPAGTTITTNALPTITIRSTTTNSIVSAFVAHRLGTATQGSGETLTAATDLAGTGGNVARLSSLTKPGGGDVTLAPTLSAATEWVIFGYEIT